MQQIAVVKETFEWTPIIVAVIVAVIGPLIVWYITKRRKK